SRLEEKVAETTEDIEYRNGALEFDSDILELEHGIYISVYASNGTLLYGKIPYAFDNTAIFEDGSIRRILGEDGTQFYLMDMFYQVPGHGTVDIRGVTSITDAEENFVITVRLAIIFLPLLVVLTACMGFYITGRTLRPVGQITDTVRSIQKDKDLSRRINLGNGKDEIYRMAATFDDLLESVEKSLKREQQFTSDVAHELRTPISTMLLQCEDLLAQEHLDEETREGVQVLYQKTKHLSQMTSQLLLLSRADQGRAKVEKEMIDFSELTQMAADEISVTAQEKHIALQTDIQPEIFMMGDETLLIRMWMNLLHNAVKYGKKNGHIWLSLRKWGNEIQAEIRDDGIGIEEKDLLHIWERFYQADQARTQTDSAGLGLSMVQWIVKEHGGTIQVNSKVGEGTSFYISLPQAKQ
ncbi:MAG: HAMP domain-containing sensor histidine kinase, partial [Ruminococcus sp.]|nr:HAMP domain-containing sensor histidine kinase [Ruminococcus sp.]